MPIDQLPGALVVPTRDESIAKYKRDYALSAGLDAATDPQVDVDAAACTDMILPLYAAAVQNARLASLRDMTSAQLEAAAEREGLPPRLPATGSRGFVVVNTSLSGAYIEAGQPLTVTVAGKLLRFIADATGTRTTGQSIAIRALDTGPQTNLPAGTILVWSSPPAGLGPMATVLADGSGNGLTGGHDIEGNQDLIDRIIDSRANPKTAGNDGEYQQAIRNTPGVPVEQPFTYPALFGPGTYGLTFTLRDTDRLPNADQVGAVGAQARSLEVYDDSLFPLGIQPELVTVVFRVKWTAKAKGWANSTPWPAYAASASRWFVVNTGSRSASAFRIGNIGTPTPPAVGNAIAFWDPLNSRFVRKTFLTVTSAGGGAFDVTCDLTNGLSDQSYVPLIGASFCPWSDGLGLFVPLVQAEFAGLGPGDAVPAPVDNQRQARSPSPDDAFPDQLTAQSIVPFYSLPVSSVTVAEPVLPRVTTAVSPGDDLNLLTLDQLLVFPS